MKFHFNGINHRQNVPYLPYLLSKVWKAINKHWRCSSIPSIPSIPISLTLYDVCVYIRAHITRAYTSYAMLILGMEGMEGMEEQVLKRLSSFHTLNARYGRYGTLTFKGFL